MLTRSYKVYGKSSCPHCSNAVNLLHDKGVNFAYIDIELEGNEVHLEMLKSLGVKSVPQCFISELDVGELLIGGYTDLVSYFERG